MFEANEKQKAILKTLKEVQKSCTELAIAANKAQGATQKARKAANTTAPEATKATHTADKKTAVVQTEQAANEMESGVQATQATTQQAGAIKGANQPLKPLTHVSESQAEEVAKAVGGRVTGSARNDKGYVIETGHPERPTMTIRLMNSGSGQREQAYMKISKRHRAIDKNGNWEHNPALIHIDLYEGDIVAQVQEILDKFEKMLQSKK